MSITTQITTPTSLDLYQKIVLIISGLAFFFTGLMIAGDAYKKTQANLPIEQTITIYQGENLDTFKDGAEIKIQKKITVKASVQYQWAVVFCISGIFIFSTIILSPFVTTLLAGIWLMSLSSVFLLNYGRDMPFPFKGILFLFLFIAFFIMVQAFYQPIRVKK